MFSNKQMKSLQLLYADLSGGKLLWVNAFGEPFFDDDGHAVKISPETGESEPVCPTAEFYPADLDGYWTGKPLRDEWEAIRGAPLLATQFLVPAIPFVLGGEFSPSNLIPLSHETAVSFYRDVRRQIEGLPDGAAVRIRVKE